MNSTLSVNRLSFFTPLKPPSPAVQTSFATRVLLSHKTLKKNFTIEAAASSNNTPSNPPNAAISPLKVAACAVICAAAAFGKFPHLPARAEISSPSEALTEELCNEDTHQEEQKTQNSPLTQLLESNSEAIDALKKLLQEKLEAGRDEESLSILRQLSSVQPENSEWKFLIARVLNEMGRIQEARDAFEEILAKNPSSFEALFEYALLMDRSGERDVVMRRLEEALGVAENENKLKEARDVKLIMAQMQFLRKNVEEALRSYDELVREDPSDFRPYFCKGMIYSLMEQNVEAREQFAKYRELSPKKFEVELSRMKFFGTDEEKN